MIFFRKRDKIEKKNEKPIKILFASDLHASYVTYRKFLNAGLMYSVDVLVIGGDLAGKSLKPIVNMGNNKFEVDGNVYDEQGIAKVKKSMEDLGVYYVLMTREEVEEAKANPKKQDEYFRAAIKDTLRRWIEIAEEKYKGLETPIFVNLGNDDPEYMFDVLKESQRFKVGEKEIFDVKGHEFFSYGYVNPTPWNTFREKPEEDIYRDLKEITDKLSNPSGAIYNIHAPPYFTNLDNAPLLDKDLKPVVKGGEIQMSHVGSKSVRKIIEETSPLLGLHGHIHESRGFDRIGNTLVLNPGSEYNSGILHSYLIIVDPEQVKAYQFISG